MEGNKQIVRQFVQETINEGNLDGASRYMHEDVVEQFPFPGQGPGLAGVLDVIRMMRSAFPDAIWKIEEQVAEGDKVVSRFSWSGTHRGEFFGIPATDRWVGTWGMVIDRLVDGRIKDTRILMDVPSLMSQIAPPGK